VKTARGIQKDEITYCSNSTGVKKKRDKRLEIAQHLLLLNLIDARLISSFLFNAILLGTIYPLHLE
jgi:hypothetical protein